ncbi:MAG: hypothetical protein LAO07_16975, partial [Acidobacteriia bacterium]|nr:hypothetical protein [Terriglobia bacterium]
ATSFTGDGSGLTGIPSSAGGTVTSVGSGLGLAGGPIITTGTLSLDTAFTDGRYARLNAANAFALDQTVPNLTATGNVASTTGVFSGNNATQVVSVTQSGSGKAFQATGGNTGVYGSASTYGVYGYNTTNLSFGQLGTSIGSNAVGVYGTGSDYGVFASGSTGVYGTGSGLAVYGYNSANSSYGQLGASVTGKAAGVSGFGSGYGVYGTSSSNAGYGVYGYNTATTGNAYGVYGSSDASASGIGVYGTGYLGVRGSASTPDGAGVLGQGKEGVQGQASDANYAYAVSGFDGNGTGSLAGFFSGNLSVAGTLLKSAGSFKIDHPLDPANKYLLHSFVESPDMMNIYNGVVLLDANGEAWVDMPEWFEALNSDFRYQLTAIGAPAPGLYVAEEVSGNRFEIAGGKPGGKVSWQVTGIRQDAYAKQHRIPVEEEKPQSEKGFYVHPDLFGQPKEKSLPWAHHPEQMRQLERAKKLPEPVAGGAR